jgi:hypothetical protein
MPPPEREATKRGTMTTIQRSLYTVLYIVYKMGEHALGGRRPLLYSSDSARLLRGTAANSPTAATHGFALTRTARIDPSVDEH